MRTACRCSSPRRCATARWPAQLGARSPDLLVVVAYGRILGEDLLRLAPQGAVNVHASLLPRYRGAAPIQWAIAEGERETGVTIMQMDAGLDTGDILLQRALSIGDDDAEALAPRLAALGGAALVETLGLLAAGAIVPVRQDGARATLAPVLEKDHGRLDFRLPASRLAAPDPAASAPGPARFTSIGGTDAEGPRGGGDGERGACPRRGPGDRWRHPGRLRRGHRRCSSSRSSRRGSGACRRPSS